MSEEAVKQSGELRAMFSLTHSELSGFRRSGYIHPVRKIKGDYTYPERERFRLDYAIPAWRRGMKPGVAFENASTQYESVASDVLGCIFEASESANGRAPTLRQIAQLLPKVGHLDDFICSLVEDNRILRDAAGGLTAKSVFRPKLLAYDNHASADLGWITLEESRKLALRGSAVSMFLQHTERLQTKIPVPVEVLLADEGFSIEYRNMARGVFGYNDPLEKAIYISDQLRKNSDKRRLVLMHEYFHVKLGHNKTSHCTDGDGTHLEAEANYAAIHYLVPMHTFDLVAHKCSEDANTDHWIKKIARCYQVPIDVIKNYQREYSLIKRLA